MGIETGALFALAALVFWGFGDFLIQRTTRKVGDWETLFVITFLGVLILSPFVYNDVEFSLLFQNETFFILLGVSVILLFAALLDFEALKKGKIAIVEPVFALEVPVAAILAFSIISESVDVIQLILISTIVIGLVLVSLKSHHFSKRNWLERGVLLAALGALLMGVTNFLYGFAARITNPLLTNWFVNIFLATISLFYIMTNKRTNKMFSDFRKNTKLVLTVGLFDNFAWISFAVALTLIPIVIAVALSESYIALSALLGLLINKELLLRHQKIGMILALSSAIGLLIVTA